MSRIHTLLYQYFSNQQVKLKNRINSITDRLLRSSHPISYNDLCELLEALARLEENEKIEKDLFTMIDSFL